MTASIGVPPPWEPGPEGEAAYVAEVDGVGWRLALVTDGARPHGWRLRRADAPAGQFVQVADATRPMSQVFLRATRAVGWRNGPPILRAQD